MSISSTPWEKLLRAPKGIRSPAAKRSKQDKFVLKFLKDRHPDIYAGDRDVIVTRQEADAMVEYLKKGASGYNFKHRVQLLIRIMQQGSEKLGWDASIPSPPLIVPREPARFTHNLFTELQSLRCLEVAFLKDLEQPIPETTSVRIGQTLLSAIIFGGLLYQKWLEPWICSLDSGVRVAKDLLWLDMEIKVPIRWYKENTGENVKKKPKIEESWTVKRRWVADPLTHALILRMQSKYPDDLQNLHKALNPWQCLQYYFCRLDLNKQDFPASVNALLRSATTRLGLSVPPYLVSFASGQINSVSLPDATWARLISGKAVPNGNREANRQEAFPASVPLTFDQKSAKVSLATQQKFLLEVLRAICPQDNDSKRKHIESLTAITRFETAHSGELVPVLQLLAQWATYRLTHHGDAGVTFQARLRPTSARCYISRIGSVLLAEAADSNILDLDPEELQELYLDATKAKGSVLCRSDCARVLSFFHQYLVAVHFAPVVDFGEIFGQAMPDELRVDANLISPGDFDALMQVLRGDTPTQSRYSVMRSLMATLGFRCGMRRGEVRKLCLADIVGNIRPELIIRNNRYAYAKTNDSVRRIPLRPLLSKDELSTLLAWRNLRLDEDHTPLQQSLLFCEFGQPTIRLSSNIFSEIEAAMRQVTTDMTLRYHHLRHSYSNWLLVRLTTEPLSTGISQPEFLDHPIFSKKSCAIAKQTLLPNDPLGRQSLYAVAQLDGHASPETSLSSYIHVCDYLLARELSRPELQPFLTESAIMQITGLKRARAFRVRQHSQGKDWQIFDYIAGMHKHCNSALADPLLKVAQNPDLTPCKNPAAVDLPHWTLLQAIIDKSKSCMPTVDKIVEDFDILSKGFSSDDVQRWSLIAIGIMGMKTEFGIPRHYDAEIERKLGKIFPRRPRLRPDIAIVESIFKIVERMSFDDRQKLKAGISFFITRFTVEAWSLRFGKVDDALEFISFLQRLGIPKDSIRLRHYPGPETTTEQCRRHRLHWAKVLGFKPDQCIPVGKGNRTGYKDAGSIGIQIRSTYAEIGCGKSIRVRYGLNYGLRYAIYMLAIALGHEADFGQVNDWNEEANKI